MLHIEIRTYRVDVTNTDSDTGTPLRNMSTNVSSLSHGDLGILRRLSRIGPTC